MNWLDIVIVLVLLFFAYLGYRHGLVAGLLELLGITASVGVPFLLYVPVGHVLERFGVEKVYSGALGFIVLWFLTLNAYFFFVRRLYRRISPRLSESRLDSALGILPGFVRGVIVIAIVLSIITAVPGRIIAQGTIEHSAIAPRFISGTQIISEYAANIFGEAAQNVFGFMTTKQPEAGEIVRLGFRVDDPVADPAAEEKMLGLVNKERIKRHLPLLVMDDRLREVAREHSRDMFRRGYFGHNTPEGITPFQRMRTGKVSFMAAGENLALYPTVQMAHNGLMRSPGHRANILRKEFHRVGIGALRGGRYGIMITQDFAD